MSVNPISSDVPPHQRRRDRDLAAANPASAGRARWGVHDGRARGPRAVYELLAKLGAERLLRTEIEALVTHYAAIDPELVQAVGADQLPRLPPPRLVEP